MLTLTFIWFEEKSYSSLRVRCQPRKHNKSLHHCPGVGASWAGEDHRDFVAKEECEKALGRDSPTFLKKESPGAQLTLYILLALVSPWLKIWIPRLQCRIRISRRKSQVN